MANRVKDAEDFSVQIPIENFEDWDGVPDEISWHLLEVGETPLQDWSDRQTEAIAQLAEPLTALFDQLDSLHEQVRELTTEQRAAVDRRYQRFCMGMIALGITWICVGHPLMKGTKQVAEAIAKAPSTIMQAIDKASSNGKVADVAEQLVGQDFAPGQREQCANFVRYVLSKAGLRVGVTSSPIDGLSSGEALANSFFGSDIAEIVVDRSKHPGSLTEEELARVKPGDLIAYGGTYNGYPATTITHVGIISNDKQLIDRPTASKPVQKRAISTFPNVVAIARVRGQ